MNKKIYRVKKDFIKDVKCFSNYYCENAYREGYSFIREEGKDLVYMISANTKTLKIELINVQIV